MQPGAPLTLLTPGLSGDIKAPVQGQEGPFEEEDAPLLQGLPLLENRLHLLHVARAAAVQLLQGFLVALTHLQEEPGNQGAARKHPYAWLAHGPHSPSPPTTGSSNSSRLTVLQPLGA